MTLQELEELKQRRDMGVLISREQWYEILLWAIELTKYHEGQKEPEKVFGDWIVHTTDDQPVEDNVLVDVFIVSEEAHGHSVEVLPACSFRWTTLGEGSDILKYRIVK